MKKKFNILYVYEERIPMAIRKLVINELKNYNFNIKSMTYKTNIISQKKLFAWSDSVFFGPGRYINPEVIAKIGKKNFFQLWSSGYDKFNVADCSKKNIVVCNNGSQNYISVAEHAVLLMLSLNKKLINFHKITVDGKWKNNSHGFDLYEMHSKTLGIIGLGKIGLKVAEICRGFNMNIIYHDVNRKSEAIEKKYDLKYVSKNTLLKKSDIVTLHIHLSKKTRNYINNKNIKLLKKSSILINVSRAELIHKASLFNCLKNKKIRGAGLDVHYQEPTKKNDSINSLDNVIVTPHIAGSTYDTHIRVIKNCVLNIYNYLNGNKIKWRIN